MDQMFADLWNEESRKARQAVRDFVEGAKSGDLNRMEASYSSLDFGDCEGGGWRRAFRKISHVQSIPDEIRKSFLQTYLESGDHIRQEVGDDRTYASGLRSLLPPYAGPSMLLYRGEGALNRKHRRYGLAWSAARDVARAFAETGSYRCSKGGSVLLATRAIPEAIICAPALISNNYGEEEFIVDLRCLGKVQVEERFPQITHQELLALKNQIAASARP
jgi:hypothetical protein